MEGIEECANCVGKKTKDKSKKIKVLQVKYCQSELVED